MARLLELSRRTKELWKELILAGRVYPGGLEVVRRKAKPQFLAMRDEADPDKIEAAHHKVEYITKELYAISAFAKYRAMRRRYGRGSEEWEAMAIEAMKRADAQHPMPPREDSQQ